MVCIVFETSNEENNANTHYHQFYCQVFHKNIKYNLENEQILIYSDYYMIFIIYYS